MSSRANWKRRQRGELPPATKRERAEAVVLQLLSLAMEPESAVEARMRAKRARFAAMYGVGPTKLKSILEGA